MGFYAFKITQLKGYFSSVRYFLSYDEKRLEKSNLKLIFKKKHRNGTKMTKTIFRNVRKYVDSDIREGTHTVQYQVTDH